MQNKSGFKGNLNENKKGCHAEFNSASHFVSNSQSGEILNQVQDDNIFYNSAKAFTLIELLVVVLIIGILAAVALPQYEKAVEKSRATEALVWSKHLAQAEELYYLANGSYTEDKEALGVKLPNSKFFDYRIDSSTYNIIVTRQTTDYRFRYFMQNTHHSSLPLAGRWLCIAKLDNAKGTAVCRSLATGDKEGFVYPYTTEGQAYYLN